MSRRIASRSFHIFTCVLLTVVLHADSTAQAGATTNKSSSNVIRVWTIGSPHTGALPKVAVPLELRQGGTWRLLAITHDPMKTVIRIPVTNTNALDQEQPTGSTLEPARPLMPDGMFPVPKKGERFGDFIWQPSPSSDVVAQVVEFPLGKDKIGGLTRLFFLPPSESKLSSGLLMSGGTSAWRVWSISKAGDVVFSEQHSFKY